MLATVPPSGRWSFDAEGHWGVSAAGSDVKAASGGLAFDANRRPDAVVEQGDPEAQQLQHLSHSALLRAFREDPGLVYRTSPVLPTWGTGELVRFRCYGRTPIP